MSLVEQIEITEDPKGIRVVGVQINQMMALWPHVSRYFESFQDRARGELTAGALLLQVMKGLCQCWLAIEGEKIRACALTEIMGGAFPVVVIGFCSGEGREDWYREIVDEVERWAESRDISRVRIICRPGWTRELKRLGYRETHRVLERDLEMRKI